MVHHKLRCVSHRKYGRLVLLRKPFRFFVFASQTLQVFRLALRKKAQYVVVVPIQDGSTHANCNCRCEGVCCPIGVEVGECCAYQLSFPRLIALWNSSLCPKPKVDDWHKHDCLMGECNLCGIKTLKICPIEQVQRT